MSSKDDNATRGEYRSMRAMTLERESNMCAAGGGEEGGTDDEEATMDLVTRDHILNQLLIDNQCRTVWMT